VDEVQATGNGDAGSSRLGIGWSRLENVISFKVLKVNISDDRHEEIAVNQTKAISFVESKNSLAIEALDTLVVRAIDWSSEGLVVTNLPAGLYKICSWIGSISDSSSLIFIILCNLLLTGRNSLTIYNFSKP
jgi:hypothetical protein